LFFGCNNVYFLLESVKRLAGVVRMTYKVLSGTHCVLVTTQMTQSCVIFLCTCQCYYCRFLTVEMLIVSRLQFLQCKQKSAKLKVATVQFIIYCS